MGDEQRRHAALLDHLTHESPQLDTNSEVERRQRLIEQQEPGLTGEGSGERNPLALPTGQLAWVTASEVGGADPFEPVISARSAQVTVTVADREGDVVTDGSVREQQSVLEHHPEVPVLGAHVQSGVAVGDHLPVDGDGAAIRAGEPGDEREGQRLACS